MLSLGSLLAVLAWRRCKAVTAAVVVATFSRPLVEFVLKRLVGRDRLHLERLVAGNGPSFLCGHPLAAIALWGMIPVVVGLFTRRRTIWWASAGLSAGLIAMISASRLFLGVPWASDIVGALLLGAMFMLVVEWVMGRAHGIGGCTLARRQDTDARQTTPIH